MKNQYYIYILFSAKHDKYYIGYSNDPWRRVEEHNTKPFNTFTSKYRPWEIAAVFSCDEESNAIHLEKFIKQQKSRRLIEMLIDPKFVPGGVLEKMIRCQNKTK